MSNPDQDAQWERAEALYVQSEKDRKQWQSVALKAEEQRDALLAMLMKVSSHGQRRSSEVDQDWQAARALIEQFKPGDAP